MIFQGRVALVTGGTSGIGRAAALEFAREGARVLVTGRDRARGNEVVAEIRAGGGEALFVAGDLADSGFAQSLVGHAVRAFGRLDCAFNNAAEAGEMRLLADYGEEEFARAVDANLKSVWLCMREEIRQMLSQGSRGGAIVNTSSVNGLGGVPTASLYAMAKAGIIALAKSAALEYAAQGIRVNVLVPGAFGTPMLEDVMQRAAGGDAQRLESIRQRYDQLTPLGRIGTPEEAARAVIWLCSDAASYVTGQSMIVDGGLTAPFR